MTIDGKKYLPQFGRPVRCFCYGHWRKAYRNKINGNLTAMDCTSPIQNTNISVFDIDEWEYLNEQDIFDYPPTSNFWVNVVKGEDILKQIKRKNVFYRIYQWLIKD